MKKPLAAQQAISDNTTDLPLADLLHNRVKFAMARGRLKDAAVYAAEYADLCFGYPVIKTGQPGFLFSGNNTDRLSAPKLIHDIAQFRYLQKQGIKIKGLEQIIGNYEKVFKSIIPLGVKVKTAPNKKQALLIGPEYNRLIYRPQIPPIRRALSAKWNVITAKQDSLSAERDYLNSALGITVIDNFLTEKALDALRKFCLESTVWFENRYAYGRLGAFFQKGFNCPLLIRIAEELKTAFPKVIGKKHPLLQLWGFKCDHIQPATAPHADFAAVNVNFWITPEEANLDKNCGGMVIYDVEAPPDWDFNSYNKQTKKIMEFLKKKKARAVTIPYKANRAIIFNSDLFHTTSAVRFKDDYESRRINITMLFGKREES